MTFKGHLYKEIYNELKLLNAPPDTSELKLRVATACYDFNSIHADYLQGATARDAALKMANEYIVRLEFYSKAIGIIPPDFKGDYVTRITHGGQSECKCLIKMIQWFIFAGDQGEELAIDELKAY